jgi:hypothetical protein
MTSIIQVKCPNCGKALTKEEYEHAIEGFRENGLLCIFCEGGKRVINFTGSNREFLSKRIRDGNVDEAITISRIAWDNFPILKESADTKKIVEPLLKGVQHTIYAQISNPLTTSVSGLNALIKTLEKNPQLIQECSKETTQNIIGQLNQIVSNIIGGPATQIKQIYEMLSQLIYKPSVKGSVGEQILEDIWPKYFSKDVIEKLGGAGKEDFLVTPYVNNGVSGYGDIISIERKSGKQTYTGAHFTEAIQHSIEKGATYSIIVYDTQQNLPQKTMFARERGVLVAVVDIESGTWKIARELFEILQKETASKKSTVNEINVKVIQEVITDIEIILKHTSGIRRKSAKIRTYADQIDEDVDEIKDALSGYIKKLKDAVAGIENTK